MYSTFISCKQLDFGNLCIATAATLNIAAFCLVDTQANYYNQTFVAT